VIRAGDLRDRVTIQAPADPSTAAADPHGQPSEAYADVAGRAAQVLTLSGSEVTIDEQVRAVTSHVVSLRWDPVTAAITPGHRLLWGGRALNVVHAGDPEGRRREVQCLCQEAR
jgi:head-tail adaptor